MSIGDPSSPIRFLGGQTGSTNRELALQVYGGEVLTAFDLHVVTLDKHEVKPLVAGESARFPKTWKASSEYHSPGVELLGTDIATHEVLISVDDFLVSHTAISDLDEMLSHFDVRGPFSDAMGYELAKKYDKNVFRQIILAARTAGVGPFPGGTSIIDGTLTNTGVANGEAWINHIREANRTLFGLDVPEHLPRYFAANQNVFDAIKWATDSNGNYLVLNRDFGTPGAGGIQGRTEQLMVDGVTVLKSRNMPSTDESADTSVYPKYRGNYSTVTGVMWTPMAVGTVKLTGIGFESTRDTRRLEDFLVAKMLVGHGTLRPECSVEFKTA